MAWLTVKCTVLAPLVSSLEPWWCSVISCFFLFMKFTCLFGQASKSWLNIFGFITSARICQQAGTTAFRWMRCPMQDCGGDLLCDIVVLSGDKEGAGVGSRTWAVGKSGGKEGQGGESTKQRLIFWRVTIWNISSSSSSAVPIRDVGRVPRVQTFFCGT